MTALTPIVQPACDKVRPNATEAVDPQHQRPRSDDAGSRVPDATSGPKGSPATTLKAEREGFEPSVGLRPHRFSRPARSAAPAPLRAASQGILASREAREKRPSVRFWACLSAPLEPSQNPPLAAMPRPRS